MAIYLGNNGSSYWRAALEIYISHSATTTTVQFRQGIYLSKELHSKHGYYTGYDTSYVTFNGSKSAVQGTRDLNEDNTNAGNYIWYGSGWRYFYVNRGTSTSNLTFYVYNRHEKTYSGYVATSTISITVSVPARDKYTLSFNANAPNGLSVTNMPSAITHFYGYTTNVPSNVPVCTGYSFKGWGTSTTGTPSYQPNQGWSENATRTVYALWGAEDPPVIEFDADDPLDIEVNGSPSKYIIRGFSEVTANITGVTVQHEDLGRTLDEIVLYVGSIASPSKTTTTVPDTLTVSTSSLESAPLGESEITLVATDSAGAVRRISLGSAVVVEPSWKTIVEIPQADFPRENQKGEAIIDSLKIKNYVKSAAAGTDVYDEVPTSGIMLIKYIDDVDPTNNYWGFEYTFDADHVSRGADDELLVQPDFDVLVTYRHYDEVLSETRNAFFTTSRNQNFSNGIYNVMFVGGCDNELFPNFTSRIWWCKINDPLYFPDTNYLEVGSNDTAVQGLTKVGDYLGVVKQSKTTDTAIFLVYPTSFEEETTYAVKQGVQGVGALAKYSFNILGDETLFLSPHGIMAIVPTEDMEHKVQNRSYFVDKQMLAESGIENSYSFVHDGKYYLAIGTGKGAVYVLDGNQRNSWGNDKTNLVYECYYLENIPANCFVKYNNRLAFSTANEVCVVADDYYDAYDNLTGDTEVPVKAEWSTIFDDDGALHYYKTMQKKGNLVSILPLDKQDYFVGVAVSEEEFDEDKTKYYVLVGNEYVQCTEDSTWSALVQYYIRHISATKVYVRKDDKDPVEITRTFGHSSEIPSELFINKKFKKYKRLQFILRNEEAEDFGVDEIVKNYTVGNYAKR